MQNLNSLSVDAAVRCLTVTGLEIVTGLTFTDPTEPYGDTLVHRDPAALTNPESARAADEALAAVKAAIPATPGVYVWADSRTAPIVYHGRGAGGRGLRNRLGNEIGWGLGYASRAAEDPDAVRNVDVGGEVPLVRMASGAGRRPYYLVEQPALWPGGPTSAAEWEAFISGVSQIVCGHRGLVGGGAWEAKAGSIPDLMWYVARDRLETLLER